MKNSSPCIGHVRGVGHVSTVYRSEAGVSFVELTIVVPLVLLIVFGLLDFGIALQEVQYIADSARQGARVAASHSYVPDENYKPCDGSLNFSCSTDRTAPLPIDRQLDAVTEVAKKAACNHLTQASRVDPTAWTVEAEINPPETEGSGDQSVEVHSVTVTIRRNSGKSCIICWEGMFDGYLAKAISTFPLERECS